MTGADATAKPAITSSANPHIKLMRSLGRRNVRQAQRAFLVEGRRLVEEAARSRAIRSLLIREDFGLEWVGSLGIAPENVRRVQVSVFDSASDLEHAQGVAAICELPDTAVELEDIAAPGSLVLILDRLRDPGNLGTALRSAAATGIRIALTTRGTVDPFAPKVVRAGMGAHFRLGIAPLSPRLLKALADSGRDIVLADAESARLYTELDWRQAAALVVGGETEPFSPEIERVATRRVAIPMQGGIESLNAGVAASVLLFEAQRQLGSGS